jgi:uncharacterized repeat protein (TIGR01451 family)
MFTDKMLKNMRIYLLTVSLSLLTNSIAQENPVSVALEIYVVSDVTAADGSISQRFEQADSARPGQTVEYRLIVTNQDTTTLPEGTVVVTGPVPESTTFIANSATPSSSDVLTEYSLDGSTFNEPPLFTTNDSSEQVTADPSSYRAVRWTLLTPFEPAGQATLVYRVTVE